MTQKIWEFCKFCMVYGQVILLVVGVLCFYSSSNPAWLGEVVGIPAMVVAIGALYGIWWVASTVEAPPSLPEPVVVPPPQPRYVRSSTMV